MEYPVVDPAATGRNIRKLRVARHLRVEDVARFMGFESVQAVYKWQRGESLPSVDSLVALSVLLQTPMDDIIITREEEDAKSSSFCTMESRSMVRCFLSGRRGDDGYPLQKLLAEYA